MALMPFLRLFIPSLPAGTLDVYVAGTTTRTNSYTTSALSVANANPVVADSTGLWGNIFLDPAVAYKFVLKNSAGVEQWTVDNATGTAAEAGILAVLSKTADYVVVATDGDDVIVLVDASLGNVTITLYTAVSNGGKKIRVVKTDSSAYTVTIDPSGSQTWNGATTKVLGRQYEAANGVSNGSNWIDFGTTPTLEDAALILATQVFS